MTNGLRQGIVSIREKILPDNPLLRQVSARTVRGLLIRARTARCKFPLSPFFYHYGERGYLLHP
ncbi:MAG: hypothetical protein HY279_03625 [Nitrospinae bacterium]|nr:hypothetical protein [Nitrospinota bacterium]